MSEKLLAIITLIRSSLGRLIPIVKTLSTLDLRSGKENLNLLIGIFEVIKIYLLSCKATFHKENNKFSEILSLKFSIIKTSLVLNLKQKKLL